MHMRPNLAEGGRRTVADVWDEEYRGGRYVGERPLGFVREIVAELDENPDIRRSLGLYAGCGNGRNYLELARAGLGIIGLDVSAAGLAQIAEREPALAPKLVCDDFLNHTGKYGYIVAIQSFQHGDAVRTSEYFRKAGGMLADGGLLFVRVNAADTDICRAHRVVESSGGGFTVLYEDGPKSGLHIRFFSRDGLEAAVVGSGMRMKRTPKKITARRPDGGGSWSQWEMVANLEARH